MQLLYHQPMDPGTWDPPAGADDPAPSDPSPPSPPSPPPPPTPTTANPQAAAGPFLGLFDGGDGGDAGGDPLEAGLRGRAESSLGVRLADVRVHRGPAAATLLAARGVEALAVGSHIFAGPGVGDDSPILAHEVAHTAAQSGATGANGPAPTVDATRERDADLGAVAVLSGVPYRMTPMATAAEQHYATDEHEWLGDTAAGSETFTINHVKLTSGQVNALADYFGSLEQIQHLTAAQLLTCVDLLEREKAAPGSVTVKEWDDASGGRYSKLALRNSDHFAAHDPSIVPTFRHTGPNNASTWEKEYRQALGIAAGLEEGGLEQARLTNAFGEHFLCDAFSAGHLFNKDDAMALAKKNLAALSDADLKDLLHRVADGVFAASGDVIQQYQLKAEVHGWGVWTDPIETTFELFIETAYARRQDLVLNALVKAAHDDLSANGVMVENDAHEPWLLRGDEHLADADQGPTQEYCIEALEVGRRNLDAAAAQGKDVKIDELVARVQGLFPRPTADGGAQVHDTVAEFMKVGSKMENAMIHELNGNIRTVMEQAVDADRDHVRRDPDLPGGSFGETPEPREPGPLPTGGYYYVQPGDWLSKIAEQYYGDPMKYPMIWDANRDPDVARERQTDVISDPDVIEVGWRLFIPNEPAKPIGPPDRYGPSPTP